ncbi:MAG TPA: type II secretion system protein GspN [Kofleriaceae bacterium]|nr:type II secretion system protein GspN [Kofleriaceae bacterium]
MAKLPFNPPQLGPRTRKILKYTAYVLFGIFTFVIALQLSFPYSRVKDKLIDAASDKYTITVLKVERGLVPGRAYFKGVTITPVKTKPDEVVTPFYISELQVDMGIMPLIGRKIVLDLDATIGDKKEGFGHLTVHVAVGKFGKGDIDAEIHGNALPSGALPMRGLIGLPMSGKLNFLVDVSLPMEKSKMGKTSINWQRVTGEIALACPKDCVFGDGKTKLKPLLKNTRNQVMVGEGIDFGKINIGSLNAHVSIKRGLLKLDKFDAKSGDGELKVDYEMKLEKSFDESQVTGCLRFKGSDDLLRREPKTHAALSTTGAELRGDGLFHIRLTDRFKDMKRLNQECGPNGQVGPTGGDSGGGGRDVRPNLTVQPDEAAKPVGSASITAPPAIPDVPPATPLGQDAGAGSANPTGAAPPPTPAPGAHEQPPGTNFEPSTPNANHAGSGTGSAPTPPPE